MYCNSCRRLRSLPSSTPKFDSKMHIGRSETRFCIACGSDQLFPIGHYFDEKDPTEIMFRYGGRETWDDNGVAFKRDHCQACYSIAARLVEIDLGEDYDDYGESVCSRCLPDWVESKESRHDPWPGFSEGWPAP